MSDEVRRPGLRLFLDGILVDQIEIGDWVLQVEVDERADEASTLLMTVDMSPISGSGDQGDWDVLEHGTFASEAKVPDLHLFRRITVQFLLVSDDPGKPEINATVFDGYVTGLEPVFGEARVPDSTLEVTGTDASCLMHLETVTRTWDGLTDAQIAKEIFEKYGFRADVGTGPDASIEDAGLDRVRDRATMLQRATDAEFLRLLARRNGFETYVEPAPGAVSAGTHPGGSVVGHFHSPRVDATEQPPMALFPRDAPSLIEFRARYDGLQPTRILGWNIDEQSRLIQRADVSDPAYGRMGSHSRADVVKERLGAIRPVRKPSPVPSGGGIGKANTDDVTELLDIQTMDVPHTGGELTSLARADLRLADWFAVGTGVVQCERYPAIVRPRRPAGLSGAGKLLDGRWYVQAVRHRWGVDAEARGEEQTIRRYEADVTVVRNALGGLG